MPETLAGALAVPSLVWIALSAFAAGITYGFAGFGAALVYMPLATVFLPPTLAIATLALIAVSSLVTLVPRAWRRVDKVAVVSMIGVAFLTIPVGVAVLRVVDPLALRWIVVGIAAATLAALLFGWRRTGPDSTQARLTVAGAAGFFGGAVGLNGPLLVLFHLSGSGTAEETRANTIVFLSVTGFAVLPVLALHGLVDASVIALGLLLSVPYGLGSLIGQALFRPGQEVLYRQVAYAIIAVSIVLGVPIWS